MADVVTDQRIHIQNGDDVTLASHQGISGARRLGAHGLCARRIDLVIRELAWNLVRHAGGGFIRLVGLRGEDRHGVLVESRDRGTGIASLTHTASAPKGLGIGLAIVRRSSDEFTLESTPFRGTCIRAVIWWQSTSS